MNIQFSFRRFAHVLRWTLAYQMGQLLTLFAAAVGAFTAIEIANFIQAKHDYLYKFFFHDPQAIIVNDALRDAAQACLLVGTVMMCVGAAFAFYHLHRKNEGRRLLMLPATHLEKFLARWVVYVPLLFVLFIVAFMLGDLLRMAVWPVFGGEISFPSAIPEFFRNLKYLFWPMVAFYPERIFLVWALFLFFHALSLLSSVWIGRWGWLFVTVAFFVLIGLYDLVTLVFNMPIFLPLAILLTVGAYWLFCRFPQYKLFHSKD